MKLIVIAVGKEKDFAGHELVSEYSSRIGHYMPIEWLYLPAYDSVGEEKKILKAVESLGAAASVAILDEKGKPLSSPELAAFVQGRLNEGLRNLVFIIGGSYGLGDAIRARADASISLSKLTFPHQLVRLILAEQLYRACTIMKGEKYHHR